MKMFSILCQISSSFLKPRTKPKYLWGKEEKLTSSKISFVFFGFTPKAILEQRKFQILPRLLYPPGFLDETYTLLASGSSFILQISENLKPCCSGRDSK